MAETSREHEEANATNPTSKTERFVSKYFVRLLVSLAVGGGALAILGPWILYMLGCTDSTDSTLRLHILYMIGGVIAVLGLVETHRKNTVDREKAEVEKENYKKTQTHQASILEEQQRQFNATMDQEREKIESDRIKNNQDHIRQVHSGRRSRYTTAIEQLSSNKASIRLGGVHALEGLIDEWLADESLKEDERQKEGQIIINNLCAYIRSSFDLAIRHQEFSQDQAPENYEGGTKQFNEDQGRFHEEQNIRLALMQEIRDRLRNRLHSKEKDSGPWSNFDYNFTNAIFFYELDLRGTRFTGEANFTDAKFNEITIFSGASFKSRVNFTKTKFIENATFDCTSFSAGINYRDIPFTQSDFLEDVTFKNATFNGRADFTESAFNKNAIFAEAVFNKKDFYFNGGAKFTGAQFAQEPKFGDLTVMEYTSRFACGSENEFSVAKGSSIIETEEHRSPDGTITTIPKGCIVFDPETRKLFNE